MKIDFTAFGYQPGAPQEPKEANWLGIVMTMPKRAYIAGVEQVPDTEVPFTRIPVCWYELVQLNKVPDGGERIVVRDVESGARYQGVYRRKSMDLEVNPPGWEPPPLEYDDNDAGGGYEYANLIDFVHLSPVPAKYEVYVVYGPYESNHETIEILPWMGDAANRLQN